MRGIHLGPAACAALGLLALSAVAHGQAATQAFISHTFEENDGGWQAIGTGGKISLTHEAADVKEGKSALAFDYRVEKGTMGVLMLPAPGGGLEKARSFRFWIKADYAAPVVVALQEKEGGRYVAMFTAPAGKWQRVELAPHDFYLSEDGNDPKDPDGKLDMHEVEGVGIMDAAQMFAQGDPMILSLLNIKLGAHRLVLDDFTVSAEPFGGAEPGVKEINLEPMARPQISWFGVGSLTLSQAANGPVQGKTLQVDYHGAPGKVAGFMKRFPRGKLVGMDKISFTCAADKPAKLVVQLEERGGGKYNVLIDIAGGKTPKEYSVRFAELIQADDSKDANNKLDLDEVQQIVFMDMLPWVEMTERENTLWIGNLKATK